MDVSEIFPQIGSHVDDFALMRSVYGHSNDHVQAHYALSTGMIRMGFPSVGSWVTYGLGSENQNLPGFVVIYDAHGGPFGGPANWGTGFMPAAYQGTVFRSSGTPIIDLKPPAEVTPDQQRARLDLLTKLNEMDRAEISRQLPNWRRELLPTSWRIACRAARPKLSTSSSESRGHAQTLRPRRSDDRAVRPAMPDGATVGGARRALRAALSRRARQSEHGYLGRPRECRGEPRRHAAEVDQPIAGC